MDIWQNSKLIIFLAYFIPGFISLKVYDLLIAGERRDYSKDLLEAVGYSALNYGVLSPLVFVLSAKPEFAALHPILFLTGWFFILLVMPIAWPIVIVKVIRSKLLNGRVIDPVRRPWDYVFSKREGFWVIAHLKDGRRIGGLYSGDSYASSHPAEEAIYLEKLWNLNDDGSFKDEVIDSRGAVIACSEVLMIEFKQLS